MNAQQKPVKKRLGLVLLVASLAGIVSGCGTPIIVQAEQLCKDWRLQTKSKQDVLTEETASNLEGSNKSRVVWGCHPTKNEAKS